MRTWRRAPCLRTLLRGINELLEALGASVPPISCCVCPALRTPVPALWRWRVWALILLRVRSAWMLCVTRLVLRLVSGWFR